MDKNYLKKNIQTPINEIIDEIIDQYIFENAEESKVCSNGIGSFFCERCSYEVFGEDKFCSMCGRKLIR